MTDREQIAHLLRRFGLGAGATELAKYEPLGVQGTLNRLFDYEKVDEGFPIRWQEMAFETGKSEVYIDSFRFGVWWALRLLLTERPLQQKLAMFWHNHLVVGADKVEFGPSMVEYLAVLTELGGGNFAQLLAMIGLTPAMLTYLDGLNNERGAPNENFGREVMELFTLGIGNYTEQDVKEAARAFTGYGLRYPIYDGGEAGLQMRLRAGVTKGDPMVVMNFSPGLHDDGPKTILGETKNFGYEDTIAMLAGRTETARHLGKKLFEYFAYRDPAPAVVDHVAQAFQKSNGNTREVLKTIAGMDEFWSDQCVRRKIKDPVDFFIGRGRQFQIKPYLMSLYKPSSAPDAALVDGIRGVGGMLMGLMNEQGMMPFYPPNVKGWDGGLAWITPNNMRCRIGLGNTLFNVGSADKGLAASVGNQIRMRNPKDDVEALEFWMQTFDADVLPFEKKKLVLAAFTKAGGLAALSTPDGCSNALSAVARLVFGSPEYQFC